MTLDANGFALYGFFHLSGSKNKRHTCFCGKTFIFMDEGIITHLKNLQFGLKYPSEQLIDEFDAGSVGEVR
jgi:hypothetical protein